MSAMKRWFAFPLAAALLVPLLSGAALAAGQETAPQADGSASLPGGVRFVPYSHFIETDGMLESGSISFSAAGLPDGLDIHPNGEIYGVPMAAGTFQVSITVAGTSGEAALSDTKTLLLEILDNTNENVDGTNADGQGYARKTCIGVPDGEDHIVDLTADDPPLVFTSEGNFLSFKRLYLDGRELTEDRDYAAEDGSTRITLRAEALEGLDAGVRHTIAAEFRTGGDGKLRRTSQNFWLVKAGQEQDGAGGHSEGIAGHSESSESGGQSESTGSGADSAGGGGADGNAGGAGFAEPGRSGGVRPAANRSAGRSGAGDRSAVAPEGAVIHIAMYDAGAAPGGATAETSGADKPVPKTGDDSALPVFAAILGISVLGAGCCALCGLRRGAGGARKDG